MWLITTFGFFSVVEKPGDSADGMLTIRARVKADLENLRDKYLPDMEPITANAGTDYKYRARVKRESLAQATSQIVHDLDYSNFKSAVGKQQGGTREKVYHKVWDALYELKDAVPDVVPPPTVAAQANTSYGGVLFDRAGRILLRKPANEYDGYVWTFPKGRSEGQQTPEETARREVLEETGYTVEIVGRVPGVFRGGTGLNEYFVMIPVAEPTPFDPAETEALEWVDINDAAYHIAQTRNVLGRNRDLEVLDAAVVAYQRYQQGDAPYPENRR